jgi:hypothetical protein
VDYQLTAKLNDATNEVIGTDEITYTNNSPDKLSFLWLNLEQNLFKQDSRGTALVPLTGSRNGGQGQVFDAGFKIKSVKAISGKAKTATDVKFVVTDTRMQVFLPEAIAAKGGSVKLKIEFSFIAPNEGSDRMGVLETKNGKIFTMAQWYPRMCVYDDVRGWNTNPYLGASEFYWEYAWVNLSDLSLNTKLCVRSSIIDWDGHLDQGLANIDSPQLHAYFLALQPDTVETSLSTLATFSGLSRNILDGFTKAASSYHH